jgi:hypothetical protein
MILNINSDAAVKFTNTLEKMHRSGLPNAIRSTLNNAAFDVKKTTMPRFAADHFTMRAPNFFKANSRVDMAKGWDVKAMAATVGFIARGKGANNAVQDLEKQEYGGSIIGRSFIPTIQARGGNAGKTVRPSNRLGRIKNIVNSNTIEGKSPQQQFITAAIKAGRGGFVLGNNKSQTLWKIESIDGSTIKKKPLFSYVKGRSVQVSQTGFMRSASIESAGKMDVMFAKEAKKQIERINNK